MIFSAVVEYKVFAHTGLPKPMTVEIEAESPKQALEDLFRRFNHAIPGYTGDLAEKFSVRSMCVGDEVMLTTSEPDGRWTRRYVCAPCGFDEIPMNGVNHYAKSGSLWNPA